MIQEIHDEILSDLPKYTIRDKTGNVVTDDADIALKTPVIQEGTPINKALINNIQGDLYTQDRYNMVSPEVVGEKLDLTVWEQVATGQSSSIQDIVYGNGKFVTVGLYSTMYSEDGVTWNVGTSVGNLKSVIYANNKFVASGTNKNTICSSEDGITWTRNWSYSSDYYGCGIAYGNGVYAVAGYYSGSGGRIYISENLTDWTLGISATNEFFDIAYGKGKFVAVGQSGTIFTSEDAITWTQQTSPYTNRIETVEFVNDKFVAGTIGGSVLVSEDGITWVTKNFGGNYGWVYGISYHDGEYLVGTRTGYILVSNDECETWNSFEVLSGGEITGFAFDGSKIIASDTDSVFVARTLKPAGIYLNLNVPLASYEIGKIVNIECGEYQGSEGYTSFEKPYLNINNLGGKIINETINYGQKYTLIYNGASWDYIGGKVVSGTFAPVRDSYVTVDVGFKPDLVIMYSKWNNDSHSPTADSSAKVMAIPTVITRAYNQGTNAKLSSNGFQYKTTLTITYTPLCYIAIKF